MGMEVFLWLITVNGTLRGVNEILGVGWVRYQLPHAFDDVSTPVFDMALVIVNPAHILNRVKFLPPDSLIMWHARHELLDAISVFVP
jgi:hypothetical protein